MFDLLDADLHEVLTMPVLPLRVVLAVFLLENDDLVAARLAQDGRRDRGAAHRRGADQRLVAADHQHLFKGDLVVFRAAEDVALHQEALPFSHAVLLSTGTNDGEQNEPPNRESMARKRVNDGPETSYSAAARARARLRT